MTQHEDYDHARIEKASAAEDGYVREEGACDAAVAA